MSTRQEQELNAYPKFKALYIKAFDKMLEKRGDIDKIKWNCGEDVLKWWVGEEKDYDSEQLTLDDMDD